MMRIAALLLAWLTVVALIGMAFTLSSVLIGVLSGACLPFAVQLLFRELLHWRRPGLRVDRQVLEDVGGRLRDIRTPEPRS